VRIRVDGEAQPDIQVTGGQPSRVIEAAIGSVFSVNGQTGAVHIDGLTDWVNAGVAPYAADKTGIADSTAAIQAAINACPPGGVVYLPRGTYKTTATLDLKPGVTLRGSHAAMMVGPGMSSANYPCYIQPAASFTGTSVIQIIGDSDGSHPDINAEQRIVDVTIDGSLLGGSSVDGLYARGNVQNVVLDGVTIRQMPNNGIVTASRTSDGKYPFSWRLRHVMIDGCHANGILLTGCTDVTLDDVQAIGCWGQGIVLANCPNGRIIDSRAEWNGSHGIHITGAWGDWTGSGGMHIADTSTDRNGQHGLLVDATGNTPILITGLSGRRDGRNGGAGGAGYAGLAVIGATVPVTVEGVTCYPGIDDTGTSTNSPQYGARLSGASSVTLDGAHLHGATAGLYDDGTNTLVSYGPNIVTAAGATTSTARTLRPPLLDWINVRQRGAKGDGTTDDKAAIQAALNACPKGGVVYLPASQYALSSKLTVPPYVTLQGPLADRDGAGDGAACLLPKAGFTDATVIELVDQTTGGYATANRDVTLTNLTIDGRLLTTETVQGIRATGFVHGVQLRDVSIHKVTGHAINLVNGASGNPYSWYMENVQISGSGSVTTWDGFHLIGTDHQLVNCRALGVRGNGYYLNGCANTQLLGCRSEWSAVNGYYITGSYGTGNGSGALQMTSCSTDRNSSYGVLIDSTGNPPILITGLMARRDGRNGFPGTGGGSFAALRGTGSTTPIIVHGMTCYPGVGDDGLGVNSPERGASFVSCTYASVEASYLHADTTPFHDGGSNTALYRGVAVATATGTTASPTRSVAGGGNLPGPLTLTQGGYQAVRGLATNTLLDGRQSGDSNPRYNVTAAGTATYGSGGGAADVTWGRGAANRMDLTTADFRIATAGRTVLIAEGTNAKMGTATLNGTTAVTISTTAVTANSRILLTIQAPGGTPASAYVSARTAGTSFQIKSTGASDTSTVAWVILEPA
jgi:hypothetical protein